MIISSPPCNQNLSVRNQPNFIAISNLLLCNETSLIGMSPLFSKRPYACLQISSLRHMAQACFLLNAWLSGLVRGTRATQLLCPGVQSPVLESGQAKPAQTVCQISTGGFPWWSSDKDSTSHYRGPGWTPGQGTRPHIPQPSLCAGTRDARTQQRRACTPQGRPRAANK